MSGGGIPIRARRYLTDVPIDPVQVGGIGYHLLDKKFGMHNGRKMMWYPGIDPVLKAMIMNTGQRFGGKQSDGNINPIVMSFDNPGRLEFIDTSNSDAVIASFSALGATFPQSVPSDALPGGSLQRTSHPGFLPSLFSSTPITSDTPGFVGPNTYLWKHAVGSAGVASVNYAYKAGNGAITHDSAEAYTLGFNASTALSGIGLRSWFFDPSLAYDGSANHNRHMISIWGPTGELNTIRVGRNGVYNSITIMGANAWQRVAIDIPVHDISQSYAYNSAFEPYAVDWFYNTTGGQWFIGEPTVQNIDVLPDEIYQYRSLAERMAVADAYFWTPTSQYLMANQFQSFQLPTSFPALHANATYDVVPTATDHVLAVTEKDQRGFTLNTADVVTSQWKTKFQVGYRGPLTDIA